MHAKVLVVGGAGYVGSAVSAWLLENGHRVWVLDDLSTGHRELLLGEGFTEARAGDRAKVLALLKKEKPDCVMHFAARSLVAESVAKPAEYFENNVDQTRALLETMVEAGVRHFIFSSTCAIFGDPGVPRINEAQPKKPLNPYGETKLEAEKILEQFAREKNLRSVALRYFNASGAEPKQRVGEWHEPEAHLIPRILKAAIGDQVVEIYGTDYATPDGTCVRDYVHVWDLAAAHGAAMLRLLRNPRAEGSFEAFNLGSENGFSVRQIIAVCEEVTGKKLKVTEKARRPGDPPFLVADSALARRELGFSIGLANPLGETDALKSIVASAWNWERKRNSGLRKAIFLDRDGTLNEDPGYLSDPSQMKLLPGVGEALSELKKAGFVLVVVSNQSGVGRGLIKSETIPKIHERLGALLEPWGGTIDHYELCYHRPDEDCECRKPKPRLITDAAQRLGIDLSQSFMIGDKASDVGSARNAGCRAAILVRTGSGRLAEAELAPGEAAHVADTLIEAARWVLDQSIQ